MDRRGNKDTSNFFKRLTETPDLASLKSPFPRHLAGSSRNPHLTASSTRPIQFNGVNRAPQRSVRPVAIHNLPHAHYPVAGNGDMSVSPVGSNTRLSGDHGFAYNAPAPYRSPPEYPNSVQPIRTRQFAAADGRFVPGSTMPTHIVSPISLRGNVASSFPGQLHSWYVVLDAAKGTISVHGTATNADGARVFRRSSAISRAADSRTLMTSKGSCYQLVGSADVDTMRLKGFPEHLIPYFVEGFPQTWKQLLENHFGGSMAVGGYHGATSTHYSRPDGLLRPNPAALSTEDSIEEYGGLETPSSSGLSGTTYINSAMSPESLEVNAKPQIGANSVYSSGSSLFLNRKFGSVAIPAGAPPGSEDSDGFRLEGVEESEDDGGENSSGGDSEKGVGRITECDEPLSSKEESEEPPEPISPELPATASAQTHVQKTPSLKSSMAEPFSLSPNRPVLRSGSRAVSAKANATQRQEMLDNASKKISPAQHTSSPVHSAKKRAQRKAMDSSDDSSGQKEYTSADIAETADDVEGRPLVESGGGANNDTPSKPTQRRAIRGGSSRRFLARRGAKMSSITTPTRLATRRGAQQQPINESADDTDLETTPVSAKVTRATISAANRSSESDDPGDGMRFDLDGDSDESEELGVAPSKARAVVTPRRQSRVVEPASVKKAKQGDSVDDEPLAAGSADEAGDGGTPLKTPQSAKGSATPKWKAGRRYFRYKEPETPSTSVTRSGRKVRKPQDWWANAQEHLDGGGSADGSIQKEPKIKYKWGSGEAVVVQDGKRVRLSDFYLQGGDDEALFGNASED